MMTSRDGLCVSTAPDVCLSLGGELCSQRIPGVKAKENSGEKKNAHMPEKACFFLVLLAASSILQSSPL